MPSLRMLSIIAGLLLAPAGCGTMANLEGRKLALIDLPHQEAPTPFGGVGRDIRWISSGVVCFVADIPFSLVGDIVTLPKVISANSEGFEIGNPQPKANPQANVTSQAANPAPTQPGKEEPNAMHWPKDWSAHVGQRVTVEGVATNQKVGASLCGDGEAIFIDGIHSWPAGYYFGGEQGKRLRVTGTVIERHDLPVFIPKPDKAPPQGIPVPEGTDLQKASQRFLLQNARWAVVE
ncbi:hypothetical protein AYO44_06345 [Planctomycetaceae bacterium SCGC AG-212-F19]|nr:hypothetical protein AYO44_06345 [Planctomycetaceae bacterium SCGC AG-212-F19]